MEGAGVRIESREQFKEWLDRKKPSKEICVALAARAALRALPLAAADAPRVGDEAGARRFAQLIVALFRATALARVAAKYPTRANELRAAARAAADVGAAAAAAATAYWDALSADVSRIEAGVPSRDLADAPLWPKGAPDFVESSWRKLAAALPAAEDWPVWTQWYHARLKGEPWSEAREIIFATVPVETWDEGAAAANAWIAERLAELDSAEISQHIHFGDFVEAEIRRPSHEWDFFVSYNERDKAFALFVDDVLRKAGYRVFAQFRDMPAGSDFIVEMNRGLAASGRLVAILSPHYVTSKFCQAEWNAVYRVDPLAEGRKIIPFLVEAADLSPLAAPRVYISLVGLTSERATAAVLEAVGYNGVVTPSVEWPGARALDEMSRATRGVFDVRPTADGRLDRVYVVASGAIEGDYGFSKEDLYADARQTILNYHEYLSEPERGNYDRNLSRTARNLLGAAPQELSECRPLTLNCALVEALNAIDLLDRAGELPQNDFIRHYQAELRGIYERLAALYPQLSKYRETARKDRQTPPNKEARAFIEVLFERTGDVATPQLAKELSETGEGLKSAEESVPPGASEAQRKETMYEPLKAASAQAIPVWNWLTNAAEKFKASGKSAAEVATAIENYTKLAKQIPGAEEFFKWLAGWWY